MDKRWKFTATGVGVLLLALLLVLLFSRESHDNKGTIYRVGVITSLTGPVAPYGQSVLNGIRLAADEIANGPHPHIELIVEDDASTTQNAVSAFKKLSDVDRVPVIVGPVGSSQAMVCSPIANARHVVLFSPSASTPDFSSPDDYTFRNRPNASFEVWEMARVAVQVLNYKNGAVIYVNNDFGAGNRDAFVQAFEHYGGTILAQEAFEQAATDMRAQLTKISSVSPDFIYLLGQVVESGYVLKQAAQLRLDIPFLSHISIEGQDVLEIAGDAANGVVYTTTAYDPSAGEVSRNFEEAYLSKYDRKGDMFAANAYDAIHIIRSVISRAGYDADAIKQALYNIQDYQGAAGLTRFDRNGDVERSVTLKRIQNGGFAIISEDDLRRGR